MVAGGGELEKVPVKGLEMVVTPCAADLVIVWGIHSWGTRNTNVSSNLAYWWIPSLLFGVHSVRDLPESVGIVVIIVGMIVTLVVGFTEKKQFMSILQYYLYIPDGIQSLQI